MLSESICCLQTKGTQTKLETCRDGIRHSYFIVGYQMLTTESEIYMYVATVPFFFFYYFPTTPILWLQFCYPFKRTRILDKVGNFKKKVKFHLDMRKYAVFPAFILAEKEKEREREWVGGGVETAKISASFLAMLLWEIWFWYLSARFCVFWNFAGCTFCPPVFFLANGSFVSMEDIRHFVYFCTIKKNWPGKGVHHTRISNVQSICLSQ